MHPTHNSGAFILNHVGGRVMPGVRRLSVGGELMIGRSLLWGAAATAALAALHALSLLNYLPSAMGAVTAWLLYPATMLWHVTSRSAGFYVPYSAVDVPALPADMFSSAWYWLGLSLTFLLYSALSHWAFLLLGGRAGAPE